MPKAKRKKCCVCGNVASPREVSLFDFPAGEASRLAWINFVGVGSIELSANTHARICNRHFKPECFLNYDMWKNGAVSRLFLVPNAIPTVFSHEDQAPESMDVSAATAHQEPQQHAREIGSKRARQSEEDHEIEIAPPPVSKALFINLIY